MLKILIIRFSSIGDIVLTSPVVRCLKLQLDAEVHFLTKKNYQGILEASPYIDKIHSIDKKVGEVLGDLKEERFDYIIDLHKNIRSWQVRLALRTKSFSFDKLNFQKWLLVNFKINIMPKIHIVDRYLETTKKLGVVNDGQGLDYFIPSMTAFPDLKVETTKPFAVFAIGAAHATKRLPVHKIIEICKGVRLPIVLVGGPGDKKAGEQIAAQAGNHVLNTCGSLSLHQSALVVEKCSYVISHDTGMMHIAAALKKKIVSVWGNTVPEFGMTAYYPDLVDFGKIVEVKNLSCRPCSKIGFGECPKGHFRCMEEIDFEKD